MKKILILGLAPTDKGSITLTSMTRSFEHIPSPGTCKTAVRVHKWINDFKHHAEFTCMNVFDCPLEGQPRMSWARHSWSPQKVYEGHKHHAVIALGRFVESFVVSMNKYTWSDMNVLYVPHPSGLNRSLNGKRWEEFMDAALKEILDE